jgi:hypothetical protein
MNGRDMEKHERNTEQSYIPTSPAYSAQHHASRIDVGTKCMSDATQLITQTAKQWRHDSNEWSGK